MENQDEVSDEALARIFEIVGGDDADEEEIPCDGCGLEYYEVWLTTCNFCDDRFCDNCIDDHEMGVHERPATPEREPL